MESNKETIFLSLTENYASSWTSREGVREFVQNWYDASRENLDKNELKNFSIQRKHKRSMLLFENEDIALGEISFDTSTSLLVFKNFNSTISRKILLLGYSSKSEKKHLVGKFGEGLKLGILACLREGMQVKCETGNERWTFLVKKNNTFNENSLAVEIENIEAVGHTAFFVTNAKKFPDYTMDFLFLNIPKDVFECSKGTLLFEEKYKHKLFVKGFWIADMNEDGGLQHGVDFDELDIDRDRKAILRRFELDRKLVEMWSAALTKRKDLVPRYYDLLKDDSAPADVRLAHKYLQEFAVELLATHFFDKEGVDSYPVYYDSDTSKQEISTLKSVGKNPILVSKTLHRVLTRSTKIASLNELVQSYKRNSVQMWNSLTIEQIEVLEHVARLISLVDPSFDIASIDLVDFIDEKISEVEDFTGKISISKKLLDVNFAHEHFTSASVSDLDIFKFCENRKEDKTEFSKCCCREVKILDVLFKERVRVAYPKLSTDQLNKLKEGIIHMLLTRILEQQFSSVNPENGKAEEVKDNKAKHTDLSSLQKEVKRLKEQSESKSKMFREVEKSLREKLHATEVALSGNENDFKNLRIEYEALNERYKIQAEELRNSSIVAHESEAKISALTNQVKNLIIQLDSTKGLQMLKEEELQKTNKELRSQLQALEENFVRASKEEKKQEVNENPAVTELEKKVKHLQGFVSDLDIEALEKLEEENHEALKRITAAQRHLLLKQRNTLQSQNERLQEEKMCSICSEKPIDVVFLPCRHRCICLSCSRPLSTCPLCRGKIESRIELYNK